MVTCMRQQKQQKTYLVTWRYADGYISTFEFTDKDEALHRYSQGRFGGRKVGCKIVPVIGIRVEEIRK